MADGIRFVNGVRTPDNLKSVVRSKEDKEEKSFQEFLKDSGKEKQEEENQQATPEDKLILSDSEGSETDESDKDKPEADANAEVAGRPVARDDEDDDEEKDDTVQGIDIVA